MRYAGVTIIGKGSRSIEIEYQGKRLAYTKWQDLPDQERIIDDKALRWNNRKSYKPRKNHPWR